MGASDSVLAAGNPAGIMDTAEMAMSFRADFMMAGWSIAWLMAWRTRRSSKGGTRVSMNK